MSADLEIKKAAQLSVVELSIGSIGHGLKIPLTGQVLSLNQLAFLLNALNKEQLSVSSAFEISSIAAVLKSFSPAGKKLGPMLSISMQGFLFWAFTALFKKNIIGQLIGAFFLSLWSFVQPGLTYFLIYGFELVKFFDYYEKKLAQDYLFIHQTILYAVIFVLVLKIVMALSFVVYSVSTKKEIQILKEDQINRFSLKTQIQRSSANAWKAAFQDLLRPLFLISFFLMLLFIWQIEGAASEKIWLSLRPLATAYLLFYLLRSPWISKKLAQLAEKSPAFNRIYQKSKAALDLVAQGSTRSPEVSSGRKLE